MKWWEHHAFSLESEGFIPGELTGITTTIRTTAVLDKSNRRLTFGWWSRSRTSGSTALMSSGPISLVATTRLVHTSGRGREGRGVQEGC